MTRASDTQACDPVVCANHKDMVSRAFFFGVLGLICTVLLVTVHLVSKAYAGSYASMDRMNAVEKRVDRQDEERREFRREQLEAMKAVNAKLDRLLEREPR